jgi:1-deoxy-D-xylulose-5-phosphate reductoisomerase
MKRVAILGSTGSIGTQTLEVIANHPDELQVVALAANLNRNLLIDQAKRFGVSHLALYGGGGAGLPCGMESLTDIVRLPEVDVVVVAVAGVIGLIPTLEAIRCGKSIALASKEVLVAAGELVMDEVARHRVQLTPIDSEHSAVFQCLQGYTHKQVLKIYLTASGGPFRGRKASELVEVTVEEALNHPTWRMGGKITIDSATMFNKALELIEARWLFDLEADQIEVVVHPQSVIHSMVQFLDGSVLGQMGFPDMRLPIKYALLYPERAPASAPVWSPLNSPPLTFEALDNEAFPSVRLARHVLKQGGTLAAAFNAANEEAANGFLRKEIAFAEIFSVVQAVCDREYPKDLNFDSISAVDREARQFSRNLMENRPSRFSNS